MFQAVIELLIVIAIGTNQSVLVSLQRDTLGSRSMFRKSFLTENTLESFDYFETVSGGKYLNAMFL